MCGLQDPSFPTASPGRVEELGLHRGAGAEDKHWHRNLEDRVAELDEDVFQCRGVKTWFGPIRQDLVGVCVA